MRFAERVMEVVRSRPGISDRHLSESLGCRAQQVNSECRHLEHLGRLERGKDGDDPIGNYPAHAKPKLTVV